MSQWYYSENGEQRGPVDANALAQLLRQGRIGEQTLVWREGMAEWEPLAVHRDAFIGGPPPAPSPFAPPRALPVEAPVGLAVHGGHVVYAGFLRRWVAFIVDSIAVYLVIGLIAVIFGVALAGAGRSTEEPSAFDGLFILLFLLVVPGYYAGFESSSWQATLGKRLLGIKVTDLDGQRIGFGRALARWLAASLSYLTFYIGFLMAALTDRKQALHDFIASTLVVDRWAYTDTPERQQQRMSGLVIALLLVVAAIVPLSILAAIAIPAYHDYTVRAKTAEVLATTGPAKVAIAEFVIGESSCPQDWSELPVDAKPVSELIGEALVGEFDGGGCGIQLSLATSAPQPLAGNNIYLTLDGEAMTWTCSSDVDSRYLPANCR